MRKVELVNLIFLVLGISVFGLGAVLYLRKLMVESAMDWELQITVLGFSVFLFAIIISKILSKVDLDG